MHAAAQWTSLMWLFCGAKVVLTTCPLDPVKVWDLVSSERPNMLTIVGHAVAKPLLDTSDAAEPGSWDASSLYAISYGCPPRSAEGQARHRGRFPGVVVPHRFASPETAPPVPPRGLAR